MNIKKSFSALDWCSRELSVDDRKKNLILKNLLEHPKTLLTTLERGLRFNVHFFVHVPCMRTIL